MVTLYANGRKVGTLDDNQALVTELVANPREIELRDDAGRVLARVIPEPVLNPNEPLVPWDPTLTREELDRRAAEPGLTIDDVRKRLGWA